MVVAHLPEGAPLLRTHGTGWDDDSLLWHVELAAERQLDRDPQWGLRMLSDIAQRASSTGINDPTTAVQALDQVHGLLRVISGRRLGPDTYLDADGRPRVFESVPRWEDFVALGVDEIRREGGELLQVSRRLRAMLDDLLEAAPP